jgi:phenylacetate-CoA ligase
LIERQEERLRNIIKYAYTNVPFYHDLFKSVKIMPTDIKTVKDLKKIPTITKKEVSDNYPAKIIAKGINLNNCYNTRTTGSSGTPLKLSFTEKDRIFFNSLINYVWIETGIKRSDKFISIRDASFDVKKSIFHKYRALITKNISIFDPLENIVKELSELQPDVIYTYPSILSLLSKEIEEKKITAIKPRILLTVGETLTPNLREDLCQKFSADIFMIYASEEFGMIAFECEEHSGYHILTDNVVIEFVKDGKEVKAGEEGEVIITGMSNHCMPLIRYKLGDIAVPIKDKCHCGRGFPLIKHVVGRTDDYLILPSGTRISPRTMNYGIGHIAGIKAYKTIQKEKDYFVIKVVKGSGFNENTIGEIQKEIKSACLGEEVKVDVELVNEIAKERTGKVRAIVSKVT